MKKIALIILAACSLGLSAQNQGNNPARLSNQESFQEFRNRIKGNYDEFRKTILDHYADFLNGEWHEYESLNGLKRDETPKPEEAPRVDLPNVPEFPPKPDIPEKPVVAETKPDKPAPTAPTQPTLAQETPKTPPTPPVTTPAQPAKPTVTETKPETPAKPTVAETKPDKPAPTAPTQPTLAQETPKTPPTPPVTTPAQPAKPTVTETKPEKPTTTTPSQPTVAQVKPKTPPTPPVTTPATNFPSLSKGKFDFNFYEMPMELADIEFSISNHLASPSEFSTQWKNLEADKVGEKLLPSIKKAINDIGLNDYLTYKYLESYANSKFPNVNNSSKMALVHYLLVHLGYDARIAVTGKGTPLLLIPFKQTVYGKSFLSLNGHRYYIFPPEGYDVTAAFSEKVMTCQLPTDVNTGSEFDLVLGELHIPVKPKSFDLEYGPLHLKGEMNENLIPILYKYPQMPIGDYAKSNLQPELRKDLTNQIKAQLGSMPGDEGVEALLHFTQNVFQYATDDNYHGFEKPYFVEETLFYPKNDCEDRAIFYTYFLWNALGREAQLVSFPGHEAATVVLTNPKGGVNYNTNGKTFYISDPTYVGASTGMVMPSYINVTPEIDYTYSKK